MPSKVNPAPPLRGAEFAFEQSFLLGLIMNTLFTAMLLCTCLIGLQVSPAGAVETDVDMEDLTRAKVAKARAKQSLRQSNKADASEDSNSEGCGNVDIGNFSNARAGQAPKEIIVVVEGDVINSGNRCK